jgi:hypothetical protein
MPEEPAASFDGLFCFRLSPAGEKPSSSCLHARICSLNLAFDARSTARLEHDRGSDRRNANRKVVTYIA